MNPEICRKCNRMITFYYLEKNKLATCVASNDFVEAKQIKQFIKKLDEKSSKEDTLIYIDEKNDNFYDVLPSLTITNNCPFYAEHKLYDWNGRK